MSGQSTEMPPEAREALLQTLEEARLAIESGQLVNLVLIRENESGQPLPMLVGDAVRLHFWLALAQGIIMQGGLNALQLKFHQTSSASPPRAYFASHETGRA